MSEFGRDNTEALLYTERFLEAIGEVNAYNSLNVRTSINLREHLDDYELDEDVLVALVEVKDSFAEDASDTEVNAGLADALRENVAAAQGGFLTGMGLSLQDAPNKYGGENAEQSGHSAHLKLRIADEDKFVGAVNRLYVIPDHKSHVSEGVAELINGYIDDIKYGGYNVRKTDDPDPGKIAMRKAMADIQLERLPELHEALDRITVMSAGYIGFRTKRTLERTEVYSRHHKAGTFPDYIQAEFEGLLWEGTPWHENLHAESFSEAWEEALEYLVNMRDKEPQTAFYPELLGKLQVDFGTAVNDIMELQPIANSPYVREEPYWEESVDEIRKMRPALMGVVDKWQKQLDIKFDHHMFAYEPEQDGWPEMTVEEIIILLPENVRSRLGAYYGASEDAIASTMCLMARMERLTLQAFGLAEKDEAFIEHVVDQEGESEDGEEWFFLKVTDTGLKVIEKIGDQNEQ